MRPGNTSNTDYTPQHPKNSAAASGPDGILRNRQTRLQGPATSAVYAPASRIQPKLQKGSFVHHKEHPALEVGVVVADWRQLQRCCCSPGGSG